MTDGNNPDSAPKPVKFYRGEGYHAEESIGFMMKRILSSISQTVEGRLCEPGSPTFPQWIPLAKLSQGHVTTVAELARECQLDTGAMTRLLDRLEAKDLVRRVRSQADRRVVNIELTDEGRAAAKDVPFYLAAVQNEYLAGFTQEEWEQLKGYLRRILDNAQTISARGETKNDDPGTP
ncbi:MarR family winged helix-turn-helix transcriptional regulator [Variovorax sp. OV329]|uniref:MarR family winged helix-turn-helix transcriptional regulator n=1 Tax=Variovorax sp. OV329 TaxID=1882825 RepID=UPI0008E07B21|nr:MarR family winged helix-turn-helix transcriptional regulator [Variovorax sp. OV329]SFM52539.1 transcriptional regulator, MarR family [Variovorax sp. OV329]